MIARLVTRVVDTRHRPGVGTVHATVNRLTGAREVRVHLVDAARPDEWLWVPAAVVRLLDGCRSCAEVRALLNAQAEDALLAVA
jgi:hypothetical protein